jgi:tetratricopeptide (TPR) repeat protein
MSGVPRAAAVRPLRTFIEGLLAGVVLLLVQASPAFALREWYESYREARDKLIPAGRYTEALAALKEAARLRPDPGVNVRTYGLDFVDQYFPYYYQGVCYQATGDLQNAITMFTSEEARGVIKKTDRYKDLVQHKGEVERAVAAAERRRAADKAKLEVAAAMKEAEALEKARRFPEALAKLNVAEAAAGMLDARIQRSIAEAKERIKTEQQELADAAAREARIEQGLSDGQRLLDEGNANAASSRFDDVLAVDPRNAKALEGKTKAQELIKASTTRLERAQSFEAGKAFFEGGRCDKAIEPLTNAAVDIPEAAELLRRAQRVCAGLQRQRELQAEIDRLYKEGEGLVALRKYAEAQVSFEGILRLDPEHPKARELLDDALQKNVDAVFSRYRRDEPPRLIFVKPEGDATVDAPTVSVAGAAWDDRGLVRIEFQLGGKTVAEVKPPPNLETGEAQRQYPIDRELPLQAGQNDIRVRVFDTADLSEERTFVITRRLRFYETKAFFPSALGGALGLIGFGLVVQRVRRRRAVRRRFNPYIAGAPVLDDDMYFGRQRLMARILSVLDHNSLMITGERRIGKTTFLYRLKKVLAADEGSEYQFFPVFTDLQGVPEEAFFHAVMSDVVEGMKPSPETLSGLRLGPEPEGYDGRDFSHDLQRIIEHLKTRTPKKVKLALLIDEVDVLNEYSERVNQRLRSIFMKTFSENLVAVMSGVGIRRSWQSEVSPWYNFFDEIEMAALAREEAEALIKTPVAGFFKYTPEAVEAILSESGQKPYLIQKFCIHALNRMLEDERSSVTLEDVNSVRLDVLFEGRAETEARAREEGGRRLKAVAD